jgi:hypothetical protein
MIRCRGGLLSLSWAVQFTLAWYLTLLRKSCRSLNDSRTIILSQGQFKIPFRREPHTTQSPFNAPSWILSSCDELSDFLSNLHWLSWSNPSIFQANAHFFGPQTPLDHLLGISDFASPEAFLDPTKIIYNSTIACLLWILAIFLEYAQSPLQLAGELQDLNIRLQRHGLDRLGSPMMLCWLLLGKRESLELHPRSWAVVRLVNVIKMWDVSKKHNLTTLLHGYLLGNQTTEALQQQYHCVMEGIMEGQTDREKK